MERPLAAHRDQVWSRLSVNCFQSSGAVAERIDRDGAIGSSNLAPGWWIDAQGHAWIANAGGGAVLKIPMEGFVGTLSGGVTGYGPLVVRFEPTDLPVDTDRRTVDADRLPVESGRLPVDTGRLPVESGRRTVDADRLPAEAAQK